MKKLLLINKTPVDSKILEKTIKAAARYTRTNLEDVPIVIRLADQGHGCFHTCGLLNLQALDSKRYKDDKWIAVHKGYITIWLGKHGDVLYRAERFFKVCAHEFCHANDAHKGNNLRHKPGSHWASRPAEISVFNRLDEICEGDHRIDPWKYNQSQQEAILELGMALESTVTLKI
jgi:hypothetical protein